MGAVPELHRARLRHSGWPPPCHHPCRLSRLSRRPAVGLAARLAAHFLVRRLGHRPPLAQPFVRTPAWPPPHSRALCLRAEADLRHPAIAMNRGGPAGPRKRNAPFIATIVKKIDVMDLCSRVAKWPAWGPRRRANGTASFQVGRTQTADRDRPWHQAVCGTLTGLRGESAGRGFTLPWPPLPRPRPPIQRTYPSTSTREYHFFCPDCRLSLDSLYARRCPARHALYGACSRPQCHYCAHSQARGRRDTGRGARGHLRGSE